jgi:hypothetical protein
LFDSEFDLTTNLGAARISSSGAFKNVVWESARDKIVRMRRAGLILVDEPIRGSYNRSINR